MSVRSYTKIWLYLIWGTHNREKLLINKELRKKLSEFLFNYAKEKNIFIKVNYVNSDHVHSIIDLPTDKTIAEVMQLLKGASSYWINQQVDFKFAWAKGYAAFSVSESNLTRVINYILNQEEHHHKKSFTEEYEEFLAKHNFLLSNSKNSVNG